MRTSYKIATKANGIGRKSPEGLSLWYNEKQNNYKSLNEEERSWMLEIRLG